MFIENNALVANEIMIYDILGNIVMSIVLKTNPKTVNLEHLSAGIYFVVINPENICKLIIKN